LAFDLFRHNLGLKKENFGEKKEFYFVILKIEELKKII